MTWNFRLVRWRDGDEQGVAIHEAYYDEVGGIGWTENPVTFTGRTPEEVAADLRRALEACERPIIETIRLKPGRD